MISPIGSRPADVPVSVQHVSGEVSQIGVVNSLEKGSKFYGKFSETEVQAAFKAVNAQEYMAFGRFAGDASNEGIIRFGQAYLSFYDSLSVEDKQAKRYAGTRESIVSMIQAARDQQGQVSETQDSTQKRFATSLADLLFEQVKKELTHRGMSVGGDDQSAVVTLSSTAIATYDGLQPNGTSATYEKIGRRSKFGAE